MRSEIVMAVMKLMLVFWVIALYRLCRQIPTFQRTSGLKVEAVYSSTSAKSHSITTHKTNTDFIIVCVSAVTGR